MVVNGLGKIPSEALLAAIFESCDDAVITKTLDGRITSFNPGAARMYGYSPEEVIGQSMSMLIPADRAHELADILGSISRGEHIDHYETKRVAKNGALFDVSVTASPIRDGDGEIIGVSAIARDITDRLSAAAERLSAQVAETTLLDNAPIILCSFDMDGMITSYRTGRALPQMQRRSSEVLGRSVFDINADDVEAVAAMRRALQGEIVEMEIDLFGLIFDVRFVPERNRCGEQTGVTAIAVDVSEHARSRVEQHDLEKRLRRYERLESLGQLAGGIAHDFNNLLGVIINCASFVVGELDDEEAVRSDVRQIEAAAERAGELTHQLLAFARREVLQPQVVDLNSAIRSVEAMLNRTLGEHVILKMNLGDGLWPVTVDIGQFEQVFVNLAVNARDAMPFGGSLSVQTRNVELTGAYRSAHPGLEMGRYVELRVSDNGTGMEQSVVDRAFDPFFTTKPPGEGTGLGLATVFGIVSQAGGDVQIYSEPSVGTTCRVLLPASSDGATPLPTSDDSRALTGSETVLVVEDEEPMREVVRRLLQRNGYDVVVAADGREALAISASMTRPIDLLLTDVVMPHMLGKEVAERLTEARPDLRVLFMSGHAHPVLGPILDESASMIEKPFNEKGLLSKIRDVLEDRDLPSRNPVR